MTETIYIDDYVSIVLEESATARTYTVMETANERNSKFLRVDR